MRMRLDTLRQAQKQNAARAAGFPIRPARAAFCCLSSSDYSSVSSSSIRRRPAVSVTGRENTMAFAFVSIPAFSMTARIIAFLFSVFVTISTS